MQVSASRWDKLGHVLLLGGLFVPVFQFFSWALTFLALAILAASMPIRRSWALVCAVVQLVSILVCVALAGVTIEVGGFRIGTTSPLEESGRALFLAVAASLLTTGLFLARDDATWVRRMAAVGTVAGVVALAVFSGLAFTTAAFRIGLGQALFLAFFVPAALLVADAVLVRIWKGPRPNAA